jgi:hypothetical protein
MPDLGKQFQLFDPPEGPAQMTEWPDVHKEMEPKGEVGYSRTLTPRDVKVSKYYDETQRIHPEVGGYRRFPHERQLAMLMSAREIQEQYAPAEGDRMYKGTDYLVHGKVQPPGEDDPRAGDTTMRQATTDFRLNTPMREPMTGTRYFERTFERKPPPIETNTEFWQRKATEGAMSPQERKLSDARIYKANALATPEHIAKFLDRPPEHDTSLVEHLQAGGDVPPVPLGVQSNPLSASRKPMVAGGQHRIGVLGEIDPDRLVPVEHWLNTHEAKYMPHPTRKDMLIQRPGYT